MRIKSSSQLVPFLVSLIIGLFISTFGVLGFDLSSLPGDLADTRFNIYVLEHGYKFFFTNDLPVDNYWNAPFFYPEEKMITYSDNLLGTFWIYSFFRLISFDTHTSFQLWFILLSILNFSSAYFFFVSLLKDKYSASIGAFIFAFSIALYGQMQHAQTFARFPVPLAFWAAVLFLTHFKAKYFFLAILFLVFQFYCAIYLGFLLFFPLAIVLSFAFFKKQFYVNFRKKYWVIKIISGLLLNMFLLAALLLPYANSSARSASIENDPLYSFDWVLNNMPIPSSYLYTNAETVLWSGLSIFQSSFEEWWNHQLFIGGFVIISSCLLLFKLVKKSLSKPHKNLFITKLSLFVSGFLTFIVFLNFNNISLYKYLYYLPGFSAVRATQRIINIELLFFGLATSYFSYFLIKRVKYKLILFLSLIAIITIDNYVYPNSFYNFNKANSLDRIKSVSTRLRNLEKGTIFSYEPYLNTSPIFYCHLDAMLAAQENSLFCLNGYTSRCPDESGAYCYDPIPKHRKHWLNFKNVNQKIEVINDLDTIKLNEIINAIKSDNNWFEIIRKQAIEKNISIEENILENAIWVYKYNHNIINE